MHWNQNLKTQWMNLLINIITVKIWLNSMHRFILRVYFNSKSLSPRLSTSRLLLMVTFSPIKFYFVGRFTLCIPFKWLWAPLKLTFIVCVYWSVRERSQVTMLILTSFYLDSGQKILSVVYRKVYNNKEFSNVNSFKHFSSHEHTCIY